MSEQRTVWGIGLATTSENGTILDTWFPVVHTGAPDDADTAATPAWAEYAGNDARRAVNVDIVTVTIDLKSGEAEATIWTNDLSHAYVHENSAYSS